MARRRGIAATLVQVQREAERQRAAQVRAQAAAQREAERARKALERANAADEKDKRRLYLEARAAEVEAMNVALDQQIVDLESLLVAATSSVDETVPDVRPFDSGVSVTPPDPSAFALPPLSGLKQLRPGAKASHAAAVNEAAARYESAVAEHAQREQWRIDLTRGDPEAIVSYFHYVLERSSYPEGFPQRFRIAYVPESKQLVVEYEVPPASIVPSVKAYRFVKTKDEITSTARPAAAVRTLYGAIIAQTALRTLHELFEADRLGHIETQVLNCVVDTLDPATGKAIRPVLLSVRTTRDVFLGLDLANVDPAACLKHLGASVSKSPAELVPVRPVLEFDMVDPRFIEASDVLSDLDQRPNLMELTSGEFEELITNLFSRMGLESRLTQASRDGGVDCVAFDPRPIFGGKVVIQAKRYKGTVGVSAVRDLFGTVHNEGASKGILVTTSGYGQASFEFANGKPLELIDGVNLLFLLAEHAGVEARIHPPDDWVDPKSEPR